MQSIWVNRAPSSSWNVFQVQLNELYRLARSDFQYLTRCSQKVGNTRRVRVGEWSLSSPLSTTHRLQVFWIWVRIRTRCIRIGTPRCESGSAQSRLLIKAKWPLRHKPSNYVIISITNFSWGAFTWLVCLTDSGLYLIEESRLELSLDTFQETGPGSNQNNLLRLRRWPMRGQVQVGPDGLYSYPFVTR